MESLHITVVIAGPLKSSLHNKSFKTDILLNGYF